MHQESLDQLKALVSTAKTCLVIVSATAEQDQLLAAQALLVALQTGDKEVILAIPEWPRFLGAEEHPALDRELFRHELGHQNLHVSFPYSPTAVDKVSYHIDDAQQTFSLVIKPQRGHKPLDTSAVSYRYTGAEADVVFLIGVHDLESLNQLYLGFEELYQSAPVVTLHSFEPEVGRIKFTTQQVTGYCELAGQLVLHLELPMTAEVATPLLAGIEESSQNFHSVQTTAETFEMVALLLRQGARRYQRPVALAPVMTVSSSVSKTPSKAKKK